MNSETGLIAGIALFAIAAVAVVLFVDKRNKSTRRLMATITVPHGVAVTHAPSGPKPLTADGVFWSVFAALWAFTISGALIYALFRMID
jgi:hypothetical protein